MHIWIDVSEIDKKNIKLAGVKRVIYKISEKLPNHFDEVRYFRVLDGIFFEEERPQKDDEFGYTYPKVYFPRFLTKKIKNIKIFYRNLLIKIFPSIKINELHFSESDWLVVGGCLWKNLDTIKRFQSKKQHEKFKLIMIVHDLIPVFLNHTFSEVVTENYNEYLLFVLSYSEIILTYSQSTKNDIYKYIELNKINSKSIISVIRLGDEIVEPEKIRPASLPEWVVANNYAICVGTIEARKNHILIYYAYKIAKSEGISLPLMIIIGKRGRLTENIQYFLDHDNEIKDDIHILDTVNDKELAWLYKNALFSVYPSQYEGWGLPIAESLCYKTPCIASNTSSMTEIAPSLVEHISPFDTRQLLEKMLYYADKTNSERKRNIIGMNYKPFKWDETAKKIIDCINEYSSIKSDN